MEYGFSIRDAMTLAETKAGVEGWQAYQWEAAGADNVLRGCAPSGVYVKGPRKGKPKFRPAKPGTERVVVVSRLELIEVAKRYETTEGKCWDCRGEGRVVSGFGVDTGTTYRPCRRCGGGGLPSNA